MPPSESKPETPSTKAQNKVNKNDYVELKIPKLFRRPKNLSLSPLWILLLVILAFFLGFQTARIDQLKKSLGDDVQLAQTGQQAQGSPQQPTLGEKVDIDAGTLPILGKNEAKITMIEFSDFQCPYCKSFFDETFAQLKKDYIDTGKVKFAFRHLPLVDLHPNAPKAAEASECANDQKKFWEYHDSLFRTYDIWTAATPETLTSELTKLAGGLGLDTGTFTTCLDSGKYTDKVAQDVAEGQEKGATGTPSFFINGKLLVGALPYETFKTLLDQELQGK